jgi:hypothetical protein
MSIVKLDRLQSSAGVNYNIFLQVVQYQYTPVFEKTDNAGEWDMPGVLGDGSMVIVPFLASSRIMVRYIMHGGQEDTWRGNHYRLYYKIAGSNWIQVIGGGAGSLSFISGANGGSSPCYCNFLMPSFNTTAPINFKLTHDGSDGSSGYLHLNQNNNTNTGAANNTVQVASTFTLIEVAQ